MTHSGKHQLVPSTPSVSHSNVDVEGAVNEDDGKTMNVWAAMSLIVGCVVGIGLFTNGSKVLAATGSPGMAMILWTFGAIIAFCGGLSYTEWGLMIPESGGDAPYLEFVFTKPKLFFSFMYCWCRVLLVHPAYTAALSIVCAQYLQNTITFPDLSLLVQEVISKTIAVVVMASSFVICAFSNQVATKVTTYVTFVKLLIVAFMIVSSIVLVSGGFPSVKVPEYPNGIFEGTSTNPTDYTTALFMVAFAFDGWSMLASSLGELRKPEKNIPLSMISGLSIVTFVYLGLNTSYLMALTPEEIKNADVNLGSKFASRLYGEFFGNYIMSLLIAISAFGACLAVTFAASRVVQSAAMRKFLPNSEYLSQSHAVYKTPFNSLMFHSLISCLLIVLPPGETAFFFLVDAAAYPVWVLYTITMVGLLVVRFCRPDVKERKFKVWLVCPIVMILTGVFASIFPFFGPGAVAASVGMASLLLSFPAYYFIVYKKIVCIEKPLTVVDK